MSRRVESHRAVLGAKVVVHEVAREAGQALAIRQAHRAVLRTGRADGCPVLEVADERQAAEGGVGEGPEVDDGAAGLAVTTLVAVVAVVGTADAGPRGLAGVVAWGAGGVAEVISPQVVILLAGAADAGGLAGEAAGGALVALLS